VQRGFSLLELLVTLIVIVLVTSLVTLNVGDGGRDIAQRSDLRRLSATANYALDEAQFAGWDFGLRFIVDSEDGERYYRYEWLERGPAGWRPPLSGKEIFAAGELPPALEVRLYLDEVLQDDSLFNPVTDAPTPQLIFYASGETMPGRLEFVDVDSGKVLWHIDWDLLGSFHTGEGAWVEEEI